MRHSTACVLVLVVLAAPIAVRPSPAEDKPTKPAAEAAVPLVLLKPGKSKDLSFTFKYESTSRIGWFVGQPGKVSWHEPEWKGQGLTGRIDAGDAPTSGLPDGHRVAVLRLSASKEAKPGLTELRFEIHHGVTTAGDLRVLVVAP